MTRFGGPRSEIYISLLSLCVILSLRAKSNISHFFMANIEQENVLPLQNLHPVAQFPKLTFGTLNCNTLNMATVTKHVRLRKFYGIASLKTDIILLSDIRMCSRDGKTDIKFIRETFAINPHCSYNFFDQSRSNKRGVGILVKKSLPFSCLDVE